MQSKNDWAHSSLRTTVDTERETIAAKQPSGNGVGEDNEGT
jgi:hypothetical protein